MGCHLAQMTVGCFELEGTCKLVVLIQIPYRTNAFRINERWEIMEIITKNLEGNMEPGCWRCVRSNSHKKEDCGGNVCA